MSGLWSNSPGAKIGYGILFTILVITAPVGIPLLLTGIVQLFMPSWRARRLVARSHRLQGDAARALLNRAAQIHPNDPAVIAAFAAWHFDQGDFASAITSYEQYLTLRPNDWVARGHWAQALLDAGRWDAAITALQSMRSAPLEDDSRASVSAHLALAFIHKDDAWQALEIAKAENLRGQHLGPGQRSWLFTRALAEYLVGQHSRAVQDLDRLYALDPGFGGLAETKAAMQAGTYQLTG
jgi:predicted Zn-dependent protease